MAIKFTNSLRSYSANQVTSTCGKPKMLLHSNVTYEQVYDNDNARVINLAETEGCFYGDLMVSKKPTVPTKFADILVSDQVDYEISFWFYQNHDNPSIELSAFGKNAFGYPTNMYDIRTGIKQNYFLRYPDRASGNVGRWQFARYIVYASNVAKVETDFLGKQAITSLGVGTNLVMQKGTTFLNVLLYNRSLSLKLYNFCIKPLRTPFSTGFLQCGYLIELWRKVNNNAISEEDIKRITQQKLLPYNLGAAIINI